MNNTDEEYASDGDIDYYDLSQSEIVLLLRQAIIENEENLNLAKLAKADLLNYKKVITERHKKDMVEKISNVFTVLLPVLDSCDAATEYNIKEITQIADLLKDAVKRAGLSRIISLGEVFDLKFHEAVAVLPSNSDNSENDKEKYIVEELRAGYIFKDRVVRQATVIVGNSA